MRLFVAGKVGAGGVAFAALSTNMAMICGGGGECGQSATAADFAQKFVVFGAQ